MAKKRSRVLKYNLDGKLKGANGLNVDLKKKEKCRNMLASVTS